MLLDYAKSYSSRVPKASTKSAGGPIFHRAHTEGETAKNVIKRFLLQEVRFLPPLKGTLW